MDLIEIVIWILIVLGIIFIIISLEKAILILILIIAITTIFKVKSLEKRLDSLSNYLKLKNKK